MDGHKPLQIIRAAFENKDFMSLRESLHALKGSAAEMGAKPLTELCKQAEQLKPTDITQTDTHKYYTELYDTFTQTVYALKAASASFNVGLNQQS